MSTTESTRPETAAETPIHVTRSSMPPFDEYVEEISSLWESRWLTNRGRKVTELESQLQEFLGIENGTLFANGHFALESVLDAMDLEGEVITTPFTFASTTHAIVRCGLQPVFVDIKSDDYTIDPAAVEAAITPRTSAILAVHVYGALCDVDALQKIADRHGLVLIYDAAHAFGVERNGVGAGAFGDASMFSFHATKVFNTIEGGLATVKDAELVNRLRRLQNFGITGPEDVVAVAGNGKMNEFSAAMGLCNLRHINAEIRRRGMVDHRYRESLADVPGISFLEPQLGVTQNYAYLPIRVHAEEFGSSRDELHQALADHGIHTRKYFYPLVSDFQAYAGQFDSRSTPVAREAAAEVLTLPMYADLTQSDVDWITSVLLDSRFQDGAS